MLGKQCFCCHCCFSYSLSLISPFHQFSSFLVSFMFLSALFLIFSTVFTHHSSGCLHLALRLLQTLVVTFKTNIDNDDDKVCRTKPLGKLLFCSRLTSCQNCSCYNNIATTDGLLNEPSRPSDRLKQLQSHTTWPQRDTNQPQRCKNEHIEHKNGSLLVWVSYFYVQMEEWGSF